MCIALEANASGLRLPLQPHFTPKIVWTHKCRASDGAGMPALSKRAQMRMLNASIRKRYEKAIMRLGGFPAFFCSGRALIRRRMLANRNFRRHTGAATLYEGALAFVSSRSGSYLDRDSDVRARGGYAEVPTGNCKGCMGRRRASDTEGQSRVCESVVSGTGRVFRGADEAGWSDA